MTATTTLAFEVDVIVRPSIPRFELFTAEPIYGDILAIQGIADTCPVVTAEVGSEFHVETPSLWSKEIYMQVNITESVE